MIAEYHQVVRQLRRVVERELGSSRERSLALTKLDEMEMWIAAADANNVFEEVGVDRVTGLSTRDPREHAVLQEPLPEEATHTPAELKANHSEETLVRAADALMEHMAISEEEAADIIRILNNAHVYLRDS